MIYYNFLVIISLDIQKTPTNDLLKVVKLYFFRWSLIHYSGQHTDNGLQITDHGSLTTDYAIRIGGGGRHTLSYCFRYIFIFEHNVVCQDIYTFA